MVRTEVFFFLLSQLPTMSTRFMVPCVFFNLLLVMIITTKSRRRDLRKQLVGKERKRFFFLHRLCCSATARGRLNRPYVWCCATVWCPGFGPRLARYPTISLPYSFLEISYLFFFSEKDVKTRSNFFHR